MAAFNIRSIYLLFVYLFIHLFIDLLVYLSIFIALFIALFIAILIVLFIAQYSLYIWFLFYFNKIALTGAASPPTILIGAAIRK